MNLSSMTKKQLIEEIHRLHVELDDRKFKSGHNAEQQLNAHRLSTLVAHLPSGIIIETPERKVMHVNQKFCDMFGIEAPPAALQGFDCREAAQQVKHLFADSDEFISRIEKILDNGQPVYNEQLPLLDGRVFERDYVPVEIAPGQVENIWHYRDITEHKKTEKEIRESEEKYRILFESAVEGILVANIQSKKFIYANPAICKLLGYAEEDFLKLSVFDIHPADAIEHVMSEFEAQVRKEKTTAFQIPCLKKDGSIFHANISATRMNIMEQECSIGFFTDITSQKRFAEQLRVMESIINKGPAVLFQWKMLPEAWPVEHVSENVERILGYTADELISGKVSWPGITHPDDVARLETEIDRYLKEGINEWSQEYRIISKSGDIRWIKDWNHVITNPDGKVTGIQAIVIDITERKQIEKELLESEKRYRTLSDDSPIGIIVHSEGIINYVNNASLKIIGAENEDELLGKPIMKFIHPDYHQIVQERVKKLYSQEKADPAPPLEEKFIRLDGQIIDVEVTAKIIDFHGKPASQVIVQDITSRKQAEQALYASEERFKKLFNSLGDAVFVTEGEGEGKGCILEVNHAAELQSGYDRDELIGMNIITDLAVSGTSEMSFDEWDERISKGKKVTTVEKKIKKDGTQYWTEVIVTSIEFKGLKAALSINHDITQRKNAETELKRNVNFTNALLHAIPTPVFYKDKDGKYLGCNQSFTEMMGVTQQEIRGKTVRELWPSEQAEIYHQKDLELMGNPKSQLYEFEVTDKDGTIRPVIFIKNVFRDENGHVAGIVGAFLDIRERIQVEEALRKSEEKYRRIVETAQEGIWILDSEGKTTYVNKCMCDMLKYTGEEMIGCSLFDFMDTDERIKAEQLFERRKQGISDQHDFRFLRKNGVELWTTIHTSAILGDDGQFMGALGMVMDITERKRAEEKVKRRADEFAALYETTSDLAAKHPDISSLLNTIVKRAIILLDASDGGMYLYDESRNDLVVAAATNPLKLTGSRVKMGEGMAGRVAQTRKPLVVDDYKNWPHRLPAYEGTPLSAVVEVPMLYSGELIGVLAVEEFKESSRRFNEEDARLLSIFAGQAAGAVHREQLFLELEQRITERKQAELSLRESEHKYKELVKLFRTISDNMTDMLWAKDMNNKYIFANKAICENLLIANDTDEPIGKNDMFFAERERLSHPDNPNWHTFGEICRDSDQIVKDSMKPEQFDEFGNVQGRFLFLDVRKSPLFNNEGKMIGVVGSGRDVTIEREIQKELRESEKKFRVLAENVPGVIYLCKNDERWTMIYLNDMVENLTGYPKEDFLNDRISFVDLYHPDDSDNIFQEVDKKLSQKESFHLAYRIKHKSGRWIWIEEFGAGIFNDGDIVMLEGVLIDITDRKQAEDALHESEEKYRHLIQHSADAIYLLYNRRFEIINEKFSQLFGITLEDVNKPDFDFINLVAPKSRQFVENRIARQAKGEKLEPEYEFTAINTEGQEIEIEASVTHIKFKDGIAAQGILRDITERKRLENQLLQSQKMEAVGQLAGGVAHDFNNLLTVINGYCDLLILKDMPLELKKSLEQIKSAGEKASRLTAQLLAFSRKQIIQPKVLKLNDLITDYMKMLSRLIGENIDISLKLSPELAEIKADPGQIEQIITNIVINSRDAMPYGGKLTIETANVEFDADYVKNHNGAVAGKFVMLAISDNGAGMDDTTIARIFEPFFTTKDRDKGTGLGLATVYGVVKQNNGFIYVYSEPEKGTTFKIYLPQIKDKSSIENDKNIKPFISRDHETILLVEDDAGVREITSSTLSSYGYTVLTAANGEEAIKLFAEHKHSIDLLLTDVVMPFMSGREVAEKLLTEKPMLKVLYFSGYTDNSIVHHGVLDEGMDFIQKPYSHVELSKKIREVLDN